MVSWLGLGWAYGARAWRSNLGAAGLAALLLAGAGGGGGNKTEACGDSLTQGYGLTEGEGFVPQLEAWLREQGAEVSVINAGVSGDTTAGGRARVDWVLGDGVDGVILALGGNDMLRGLDPAESRANLDAILAEIGARGLPVLLAGIPSTTNYGPDYREEFEAIFPGLAEEHGALYYPNFLAGLGAETLEAAQPFMQGDGIHPNAEGVRRIVLAIGPAVLDLVASAE
ncbi:arylesterase [soil metagenome]